MNFSSDAMADFEGLLEVNRKICKQQMAEKGIACAANELCGIALGKAEGAAEAPAEMAGAFHLGCCTEGMGYLFGIMDSRRTDGG